MRDTVTSTCSSQCRYFAIESRNVIHQGYRRWLHVWMDKHVVIFMEQYNVKVRPHYTAQQNATDCSLATQQKLLGIWRQFDRVRIKKYFFADYTSGYKNCGTKPVNFVWFFFSIWLMPFWNPLLIKCHTTHLWWDQHFAYRIFMPRHAEALTKPRRIDVHIILTICHTERLYSALRYSVDAPLQTDVTHCSYVTR